MKIVELFKTAFRNSHVNWTKLKKKKIMYDSVL